MRRDFRKAKINHVNYVYPFPVIKEEKYLISVENEFTDFFIESWKKGFLASPDIKPIYLQYLGIHQDQKTQIYQINYGELYFEFLSNTKDPAAITIQKLLSSKIISFLKKEPQAKLKLEQAFHKQLKCKTCCHLGIGSELVLSWISFMISISNS